MTRIRSLARPFLGSVLLVLMLAVTGCGDLGSRPADEATKAGSEGAAPSTFSSGLTDDVSGYYMPTAEYRAGNWVLRSIFIGQAAEFESWEAGRRSATFAPIMLEFEDVTSPLVANEIGQGRSGQIRVLPLGYTLSADAVMFEGLDPALGRIALVAELDLDALATSRRNLGTGGTVLVGSLAIGERSFEAVGFRWWAGD